MTPPGPLATTSLVACMDFGQFSLDSGMLEADYSDVVDRALYGDGISQDDGIVVVISPHQYNSEMPVEVQLWAGPPPDDLADWQQVTLAGLEVQDNGFWIRSVSGISEPFCPVPDGRYAVRISGRNFFGPGWAESDGSSDSWRIQLWPVDVLPSPVRLAKYVDPEFPDPEPVFPETALEPKPEPQPYSEPKPESEPERPIPSGGQTPSRPMFPHGIRGLGTPENPSPAVRAWLATGLSGVYDPNLLTQSAPPADGAAAD
jgi:hypothetical protein